MLAVIVFFLTGYGLNVYFDSDAAVRDVRNAIQQSVQDREQDFEKLMKDSSLLDRLSGHLYNEAELGKLISRKYGIFLYDTDSADAPANLLFWNDQRSLPTPPLLNDKDGYGFVELSNGQYDFIKKTLT